MGIHKRAGLLLSCILCLVFGCAYSQESKPTIRHHRVMETVPDDDSSPEVEQAETAMQHNDFVTAESLLQKAVAAKPADYRAWFNLGYVYNATNRIPEATDAYRKAVAAKPDVFESNLNLGMLLARQGNNAEAVTYLKTATQLKPTASPDEALARAWQALGRVEENIDPTAGRWLHTPRRPSSVPRILNRISLLRPCSKNRATLMMRRASFRPRPTWIRNQNLPFLG